MNRIRTVFKSTLFLGWLSVILIIATLSLSIWSIQISSGMAAMAIAHQKQLAKAVMKTKARARLRRVIVAVPFAGAGAALAFEVNDYREWQEDNPEKSFDDYKCEVSELTGEVIDEVLQELPDTVRPEKDFVLESMPECTTTKTSGRNIRIG